MAKGPQGFGKRVEAMIDRAERRQLAVYRFSCQDLVAEVLRPVSRGGNMPVVTGNLRRSARASKKSVPPMTRRRDGFASASGEIAAIIASLRIGESFFLGFQAVYARRVEARRGFVRLAAQNWKKIVNRNVLRVKARISGGLK